MKKKALLPAALLVLSPLSFAPLCLAAPSAPVEKPKMTAESLYNEGVAAMQRGEYAAAAAKFEASLELDGNSAAAHNNLAFSLRKQGKANFAAALEHYNKAIQLDPKLAQAYHYRGVLYVLEGNEAAAKADHAKLLELDRELADELMKTIASKEEPVGYKGGVKARS